jgi:hypothetical protein
MRGGNPASPALKTMNKNNHKKTQGAPRIGSSAVLGVISLGTINKFLERIAHGLTHRWRQRIGRLGMNELVCKSLVCGIACLTISSASGYEIRTSAISNILPYSRTEVAHLVARAVPEGVNVGFAFRHLADNNVNVAAKFMQPHILGVLDTKEIPTNYTNPSGDDGRNDA